jgi:3-deoxy-manno-octulosonate cytidylyltransferase (CMP-KDO synthetase)
MIQMVYENARRCTLLAKVVVATDSEEIAAVVRAVGGDVMMTAPDIATGSDRAAVVAKEFPNMDVVVNLQGDEPFVQVRMLEQLLQPYVQGERPDMTTLAFPLDMEKDYTNPGAVKVVTDLKGNALYFSRSPLPYFRQQTSAPVYHHMGLYAFRRDFLLTYCQLAQTPLERAESLEQLRALEHGYRIRVCLTEGRSLEINTLEECAQAQNFVRQPV